ncbi:MAG: orotate phosphoribosyltransferase [Robiginitomaculum sp.]|nr:MAG: orotate phosphoribosyltransferase [Robiginitomaculum sp.]
MNTNDVLQEFREVGALLEGHFVLSSGRHSPFFLQKAFIFMNPARTEKLCKALAAKVEAAEIGPFDAIISPAVGGIIPGYETARQMELPAMYVERVEGAFCLRRGFTLTKGARVLIVEDIITTGLSSRECIEAVRALGANVVAEACLIDRSGGKADVGAPLISLAQVDFPTYAPDDVPAELAAITPHKPGSRDLHA